jgi:hypothetical protein
MRLIMLWGQQHWTLRETAQWSRRLGLENFPADAKKATRKLKDYYGRLGFVPMRSTPFMFLSTAWALPTEAQLCANVQE